MIIEQYFHVAIDPRLEESLEVLDVKNTILKKALADDQRLLEAIVNVSIYIRMVEGQVAELLRWGNWFFYRTSFRTTQKHLSSVLGKSQRILNKMPVDDAIQGYRQSSLERIRNISQLMSDFATVQELKRF